MRYGVALEACVRPTYDTTLAALDAFAERSRMPDLVPLWAREWKVDGKLVTAIRERGAEPVLYVETRSQRVSEIEDTLRLFACRVGDGTAVRLNQEPDGRVGFAWQDWEPEDYRLWFQSARDILRSEADIRAWWCPSIPKRAHEGGWWPGEADFVGFDAYAWKDSDPLPPRQFAGRTKQLAAIAPGTPVWIGEHGSLAGTLRRAERLRALDKVQGVEVVVVMNLPAVRPDGGADEWTWSPPMLKAFATMGGH